MHPLPPNSTSNRDTIHYQDAFSIYNSVDIALTSNSRGRFEGRGKEWWDRMMLGTLPPEGEWRPRRASRERRRASTRVERVLSRLGARREHNTGKDSRPKLVRFDNCMDLLVERVDLHNSPSWNLLLTGIIRGEVRGVTVATDRSDYALKDARDRVEDALGDAKWRAEEWLWDKAVRLLPERFLQPEDLNTDGIDPSGIDIWIHDARAGAEARESRLGRFGSFSVAATSLDKGDRSVGVSSSTRGEGGPINHRWTSRTTTTR